MLPQREKGRKRPFGPLDDLVVRVLHKGATLGDLETGGRSTLMNNGVITELRNVVSFAELAVGDQLIIETERSTYTFSMCIPSQRLGALRGGRLPDGHEAFAIGAVSGQHAFWKGGLRVGDRAIFLSPAEKAHDSSARLVTSQVVRIQVVWREPRAA